MKCGKHDNIIDISRLGSVLPKQVENTLYRSIQVVKKRIVYSLLLLQFKHYYKNEANKINSSVYRTLSFCQFINAKVA